MLKFSDSFLFKIKDAVNKRMGSNTYGKANIILEVKYDKCNPSLDKHIIQ